MSSCSLTSFLGFISYPLVILLLSDVLHDTLCTGLMWKKQSGPFVQTNETGLKFTTPEKEKPQNSLESFIQREKDCFVNLKLNS